MSITLYLSLTSSPSSPRVSINVPLEATGSDLRKLSSEATSIPLATMKLIYRGRVIADKETGEVLKEFKLENDMVIHVMGKPAAAAEPAPSSSATTTTSTGASVTMPTAAAAAAAPATTDASPLASALMTLRTSNSNDVYRTALTTADKLLKNIVTHPMEEKYRTIKKSNPAFNKRLGGVTGGEALLLASGFTIETTEGNEVYVLRPSAQAWPRLVAAGEEVTRKVAEINTQPNNNFGTAAAPSMPAAVPPSNNAFGGMPGMGGGGMPGGGDMAAMQQMMNDPNAMQQMMGMMNNPMVQNMMRNDPRFANNPMAQQALNELQRNPEMISQVTQMMSDPTMRANMTRMMEQQQQSGAGTGGANPFGGGGTDEMRRQMEQFQQTSQQFGGGAGAGAPPAPNQNGNNGSSGQSDGEMTEEEMIAEAIRRSLGES
mmetsp:Transcript_9392/g.13978  ORF Transcript_9392/g.13978 Transcript_9392/m.13978 type:complete len:431 (+) Transcript_9392:67-1359(+)